MRETCLCKKSLLVASVLQRNPLNTPPPSSPPPPEALITLLRMRSSHEIVLNAAASILTDFNHLLSFSACGNVPRPLCVCVWVCLFHLCPFCLITTTTSARAPLRCARIARDEVISSRVFQRSSLTSAPRCRTDGRRLRNVKCQKNKLG